jgi:hypothetical protein
MRYLHEAFREEFLRVLKNSRLTRTEAANKLGISRQAFHAYIAKKNGSVPRKDVLRRIIEIWPDFRVVAGSQVFDKESLSPSSMPKPESVPYQMNLFEGLKTVKQENLGFEVENIDGKTKILLTIQIPA